MNSIKANIANLTSLWKTGSEPFQSYIEKEEYAYCHIPESQWPNRIWLKDGQNCTSIQKVISTMQETPAILLFSFFGRDMESADENNLTFSHLGLSEKFIQYGMSYIPSEEFVFPIKLNFNRVSTSKDIKAWCSNFQGAFGYQISELTLEKTMKNIEFYNIALEGNPIGTVLLHQTEEVLGIHSLGISPDFRGSGYAKEAMYHVLNQAVSRKVKLVTLQASVMAKNMYEDLGFTTEFIMKNYQLTN